eukprot:11177736-Lingulodinium_polyedra.AAC.1
MARAGTRSNAATPGEPPCSKPTLPRGPLRTRRPPRVSPSNTAAGTWPTAGCGASMHSRRPAPQTG